MPFLLSRLRALRVKPKGDDSNEPLTASERCRTIELMLQRPRAISRSAHLGVLALSSPSDLPRIVEAKGKLEARGFRVTLAENIAHSHRGYLAGNDDERAEEI